MKWDMDQGHTNRKIVYDIRMHSLDFLLQHVDPEERSAIHNVCNQSEAFFCLLGWFQGVRRPGYIVERWKKVVGAALYDTRHVFDVSGGSGDLRRYQEVHPHDHVSLSVIESAANIHLRQRIHQLLAQFPLQSDQ